MAFSFTSKDGCCPSCTAFGRKWYIQDRAAGLGCYDYCLMSVTTEKPTAYRFKNQKDLAAWLNGMEDYLEKDPWWTEYFIRRWAKIDYPDAALLEKDGIQYRWDKETNTLTVLPERRQESEWFTHYRECLSYAKAFLTDLNNNQTGKASCSAGACI